jgi:hypothetical protein
MKKQVVFSILAVSILSILGASSARASALTVQHSSAPVVCAATIFAVNSTSITVRNISGGAVVSSISFGTITSTSAVFGQLAPQYVQLSVNDNSISWVLRAYTTNFVTAPDTTTWGYQYGGLRGATDGDHIAMGWQCSTTISSPACGDPSNSLNNGWTYLKDAMDVDMPETTNNDESFAASVATGYCNIAYGSASYTRVVKPMKLPSGLPDTSGIPLVHPTDYFYLYTEADFSSPVNDSYAFNLVLELVHQ